MRNIPALITGLLTLLTGVPGTALGQGALPLIVPLPVPDEGPGLAGYVATLYRFAIVIGAFLALLLIVIGAAQWALSAGNESRKGEARSRITSAIYGLVLLLAVALILAFVNPALTTLGNSSDPAVSVSNLTVQVLDATTVPQTIKLVWEPSNNATSIIVAYKAPGAPDFVTIGTLSGSATEFPVPSSSVPSLPNETGVYSVVAINSNGQASPIDVSFTPGDYPSSSPLSAPSPPTFSLNTAVTAPGVAAPGILQISWTDNSLDESNFNVEWRPANSGGGWNAFGPYPANTESIGLSGTNATFSLGTTYKFRVVANPYIPNFRRESGISTLAYAATDGGSSGGIQPLLGASSPNPSNLVLNGLQTSNQVTLSWTDNSSNETGFVFAELKPDPASPGGFSIHQSTTFPANLSNTLVTVSINLWQAPALPPGFPPFPATPRVFIVSVIAPNGQSYSSAQTTVP